MIWPCTGSRAGSPACRVSGGGGNGRGVVIYQLCVCLFVQPPLPLCLHMIACLRARRSRAGKSCRWEWQLPCLGLAAGLPLATGMAGG